MCKYLLIHYPGSKGMLKINVKSYFLDPLINKLNGSNCQLFGSSLNRTMTLEKLGCSSGLATKSSIPDGFILKPIIKCVNSICPCQNLVTDHLTCGIFEVKNSFDSVSVSVRKAFVEGINVAISHVKLGFNPENICIPLVCSNGHHVQFSAVFVLSPCFPYIKHLTKCLDISDLSDRNTISFYLVVLSMWAKVSLACPGSSFTQEDINYNRSLDVYINTSKYYLKPLSSFFESQHTLDSSLIYMLCVLSKIKHLNFVVSPITMRLTESYKHDMNCNNSTLVFENLTYNDYVLGMPDDKYCDKYIEKLKYVFKEIHECGVVHMDAYVSNFMHKVIDDEVDIKIIDWDACHFLNDEFSEDVCDRLSSVKPPRYHLFSRNIVTIACKEFDLCLIKVLEDHKNDSNLKFDSNLTPLDLKHRLDLNFRDFVVNAILEKQLDNDYM